MYPTIDGDIVCCSCALRTAFAIVTFKFAGEAFRHLQEHREAGHNIPEDALVRLADEAADRDGDFVDEG